MTSPERAPTLKGGTGRPSVPTHSNLSDTSNLSRICRFHGEGNLRRAGLPATCSHTAKGWPVPGTAIVLLFLVTMPLGVTGCGHATVPCPTPTTELDRLRSETERLREDTERVQTEEGAWEARRDAAAQRAEDAQARLDSLGAERNH